MTCATHSILSSYKGSSVPWMPASKRVALIPRTLCGLTTDEIARAFLVPKPTIAQRIVRAKQTLTEAFVPFELPRADERRARLPSVLEVIYLVFNEGYSATAGDSWTRPALCEEAMRLGRVLAGLMPDESEVHGLVALMEIQASRMRVRLNPKGDPVPLLEQNRVLWTACSSDTGSRNSRSPRGWARWAPYGLQASIAACHGRAATADRTDWARIAALYGVLAFVARSPPAELNRGVAVSMAEGPAAGLVIVDPLQTEPALAQ
jgi:predicted RNA polymerase sigma factor